MVLLVAALTAVCPAQDARLWRGVLQSPGGDLPFLVSRRDGLAVLHHGVERREYEGWFDADGGLRFPPYDARITLTEPPARPPGLRGTWRKVRGSGEDALPFRLEPWGTTSRGGIEPTFPLLRGEPVDVSGRWRVRFASDPHAAVAIFGPNESPLVTAPGEIAGTILTVTGDYRYLAGTARGSELRLAVFDGAHAFLFAAELLPDGSLKGDFWSGSKWHDTWTAHRDDDVTLPDAFTLTKVVPEVALGDLSYPDLDTGEPTELRSLFGKATLVVLFGTWCPNCGDSGAYLERLLARHRDRGLRIVGLAFEHGDDRERHARVVRAYRERYGARWPILLAGPSDKRRASAAFPAVDAVRSYPTTLFVSDSGEVRAVHQGFAGPATGPAHEAQCESFERIVRRLLAEADAVRK